MVSEEAVRSDGDYSIAPASGARTIVTHQPVGVAALVTPWNFPAAMATRKIAPALAAGCTVVLKPAAETPLTAIAVARILTEAGVPDGVVNVVPTTDPAGVVTTWLTDERVRKIRSPAPPGSGGPCSPAADRVLNASMELGGNAPFVVTADADLEAAVAGAMIAKFRNGGQACTAANRFYVHADVADAFVARFGAAVETLEAAPLISAAAVENIGALVDGAVAAGARMVARADVPEHGWFYPPTLLADVPPDAGILREEIFGPVAPVVIWTDEADLLRMVNGTELDSPPTCTPAGYRTRSGSPSRSRPAWSASTQRVGPGGAVRRGQAEWVGPRGRARGPARVPGDPLLQCFAGRVARARNERARIEITRAVDGLDTPGLEARPGYSTTETRSSSRTPSGRSTNRCRPGVGSAALQAAATSISSTRSPQTCRPLLLAMIRPWALSTARRPRAVRSDGSRRSSAALTRTSQPATPTNRSRTVSGVVNVSV